MVENVREGRFEAQAQSFADGHSLRQPRVECDGPGPLQNADACISHARRTMSTMEEVGILEVLTTEWFDSLLLIHLALGHDCEGDSDGSMFTRAALVLLYAMLDAQLSVVAQWRMRDKPEAFKEAEILFLNEFALGLGSDGEVLVRDDSPVLQETD